MRYGSICSGIEAATAAWHPLGWEPAFFSEIDAFPRAVLQHHYPEIPLHGDFTTIGANEYGAINLLVGGTPCQSFSVAGLRGGLDDDRGNLALEFLRLAQRTRARWLVWENVPGVLSSDGGRDFGSILGGLVELGYGFAYRVLDAQYFGVAQRRRRVFVVGYLGDWRPAAAVLFERESLSGNPAPRREARESAAPGLAKSIRGNSGRIDREDMHTLIPDVVGTLSDGAHHGGGLNGQDAYSGRIFPVSFQANATADQAAAAGDNVAPTMATRGHSQPAVAFQESKSGCAEYSTAGTLRAEGPGHDPVGTRVRDGLKVRRLTPVECERLQGFPDNYTAIPWRGKGIDRCPDGPRYKALGNSMAVPVMRWIGERINRVQKEIETLKGIEILADTNLAPRAVN